MILLIVDDNQQMRRLIRGVVGDPADAISESGDGALALAAYSSVLSELSLTHALMVVIPLPEMPPSPKFYAQFPTNILSQALSTLKVVR